MKKEILVDKNSFVVFIFLAALFGILFQNIAVVITIILYYIFLFCFLKKSELKYDFSKVVAISSFIGFIFILLLYFGCEAQYGEPYWMDGLDDYELEKDALNAESKGYVSVYNMVNSSDPRELLHNTKGFVIYLMYLIKISNCIGGYHTTIPRILNILFLNLIGIMAVSYAIYEYDLNETLSQKLFLLITTLPNALYISGLVYRDTMVAFFVFFAFYVSWKMLKDGHRIFLRILLIILDIYLCFWFRKAAVIFLVLAVFVVLMFSGIRKASHLIFCTIAIVGIVTICTPFVSEQTSYYMTVYSDALTSGSDGLVSRIYSMPLFPVGVILRAVAYLVSPYYVLVYNPFSWLGKFTTCIDFIVSLGTLYVVSQYIYLYRGIKNNKPVLWTAAIVLFGIILITFGYRHVMMLYPFLSLIIYKGKCDVNNIGLSKIYKRNSFVVGSLFFCMFFFLSII